MRLSKRDLDARKQALLCPEGEQEASLKEINWIDKATGDWLVLIYVTDEHEVAETFLIKPARKNLEALSVDHLERLLEAVQVTLDTENDVDDLGQALEDMIAKPVSIVVKHRVDGDGRTKAGIAAWRRMQ